MLPAIQREFVWEHPKIVRLFDSLMRGYPIGSFLFWQVERGRIKKYKFYGFMLHYHQRDKRHLPPLGEGTRDEITAVLDGQQRLTALNIGLRGSYAYKLPRRWWNSPDAFPKRHLYLNILSEAEENEDGIQYDFRFLTDADAETGHDETHCWYPVRDILKAEDAVDLNDFLVDRKLANQKGPFRVLARLHKVVHTEPVIAYYEEEDQDLDKVLDIFIRTNSGGTALSYSDMLMSIATAQWENLDAREEIHGTVDEINRSGDGFGFSQDFLLKAGLMLAGVGSVRFRVTNFNRNNMKLLENRWDPITRAVRAAVELVARSGFSQGSLSANNAVLPICALPVSSRHAERIPLSCHVPPGSRCHPKLANTVATQAGDLGQRPGLAAHRAPERHRHARWRGVSDVATGSGYASTWQEPDLRGRGARAPRGIEGSHVHAADPLVPLRRSAEQQVPHRPRVSEKPVLVQATSPGRRDDIPGFQDRADRLPNLQLLVGEANESKSDMLPQQWMSKTFDAQAATEYAERHDLGEVPAAITGFNVFYEARRDRLLGRLRRLLGTDRREREAQSG